MVVPVLVGLSIMVFLILGSEGSASPERLAQLRKIFGLDQPLPLQYLAWIGSLLSGDFGRSIRTSRPILPDVLARVPVTYQLAAMAMVLSLVLAVPLGVVSSVKRSTSVDAVVRVVGLLGLSIPNFWLASMLILLVSQHFRGGLPTSGYVYPNQDVLGSFR